MATFYGSKVGTPKNTVPATPVPATLENGTDHVLVRDTIELAAAAVNDLVEMARNLPWETVISPGSTFYFDDLGATTTLSIGDATFPTALCNAQDVSTAAGSALVLKSIDVANYFKPLWQLLGHATLAAAKAVSPACTLYGKIGASAATGTLTWQMFGQRR